MPTGAAVVGLKELLTKLSPATGRTVTRQAVRTLYQVGILIEAEAKRNCPVETGHLRQSIRTELPAPYEHLWYVEIGTDVEYAPFVEFGTGQRGAHGETKGYPIFESAYEFMRQIGYLYGAGRERPGTEGMAAHPFLFPAYEKYKNTVGTKILDAAVKVLLKGGGISEVG